MKKKKSNRQMYRRNETPNRRISEDFHMKSGA